MPLFSKYLKRTAIGFGLVTLSLDVHSQPVSAGEFDGCASAPIAEKFTEFGATGKMPQDLGRWLNDPEAQHVEPWQAFDNVYYVGICWVSSWAIKTDDGVVLIDTLYGSFTDQLVANLKQVGIELDDIKYVLMTHGHFDHVGGAATLKPLLPNARFVMTEPGWKEAQEDAAESQDTNRPWDMIAPDLVAQDGDVITLGNDSFKVVATPGHTWGTASYIYDVTEGDQTYHAMTIGGLGLNAIDGAGQVESYIDSVEHLRALVKDPDNPIQVHLSAHGFSNNLTENRIKLQERAAGDPNPLVDQAAILKQLDQLQAGAEERMEQEKAKQQ